MDACHCRFHPRREGRKEKFVFDFRGSIRRVNVCQRNKCWRDDDLSHRTNQEKTSYANHLREFNQWIIYLHHLSIEWVNPLNNSRSLIIPLIRKSWPRCCFSSSASSCPHWPQPWKGMLLWKPRNDDDNDRCKRECWGERKRKESHFPEELLQRLFLQVTCSLIDLIDPNWREENTDRRTEPIIFYQLTLSEAMKEIRFQSRSDCSLFFFFFLCLFSIVCLCGVVCSSLWRKYSGTIILMHCKTRLWQLLIIIIFPRSQPLFTEVSSAWNSSRSLSLSVASRFHEWVVFFFFFAQVLFKPTYGSARAD